MDKLCNIVALLTIVVAVTIAVTILFGSGGRDSGCGIKIRAFLTFRMFRTFSDSFERFDPFLMFFFTVSDDEET